MNQVNTIDIPPRENVTYTKETQTPQTDLVLDKDGKLVRLLSIKSDFYLNLIRR